MHRKRKERRKGDEWKEGKKDGEERGRNRGKGERAEANKIKFVEWLLFICHKNTELADSLDLWKFR